MIATSTLLSYDVYRHYFRPRATSKQIVDASRIFIVFWGVFAGSLASVLKLAGIVSDLVCLGWIKFYNAFVIQTLGWLFYFLGVATASGVFPIALTFLYANATFTIFFCQADDVECYRWKDLNREGAVAGSILGMFLALIVWLATARAVGGEITVDTLSNQWASFAGGATAIISGGVLSITHSLLRPANFDWEKTRNLTVVKEIEIDEDRDGGSLSNNGLPSSVVHNVLGAEKKRDPSIVDIESLPRSTNDAAGIRDAKLDMTALEKTFKRYTLIFGFLALIITIVSKCVSRTMI